MATSWQEQTRPWHVFGVIALVAGLVLFRGSFQPVCHGVLGLPTITLTTPENTRISAFCIDDFDCGGGAGSSAHVFVDDTERYDYTYTALVRVGNETLTFAGAVEAEPVYPNGRRCGRSGKTATLVMTEHGTIEDRT